MWSLNFNEDNTVKIKETLELTTFFIASEIANYQLLLRLEKMSTMDMLTGVKNRNKMNTMVDDIVAGSIELQLPYAVVFTDLNGLKSVNDINGHSEGDRILGGLEVFPSIPQHIQFITFKVHHHEHALSFAFFQHLDRLCGIGELL